ncbi:MAG: DUF6029 family protein [Luteibaculaceae bacterium]
MSGNFSSFLFFTASLCVGVLITNPVLGQTELTIPPPPEQLEKTEEEKVKEESRSSGLSGNMQMLFQTYEDDPAIGAQVPPEQAAMNSFLNLNYNKGKFKAGMRYESYLGAILGYPDRFNGSGVGFRFVSYQEDNLEVTVGNFYEQFGSGMLLRAYEERNLGLDNAFDGISIRYKAGKGIYLKGLYGLQRFDFDSRLINGPGIVRGLDGEISLNEAFEPFAESKTRISLGASFVSKFQEDRNPTLRLPENVGAYGGRLSVYHGKWSFQGEYVMKENDPSADNGFIYKNGYGALMNLNYTQKGLGVSLSAKHVDNMSFRSDRNQGVNDALINYLPALTKQHTYNLAATLYPFATIFNGEVAYQADVMYKFPKNTLLGKKYKASLHANYAIANDIKRNDLNDMDTRRLGYSSRLFAMSDSVFYRDFNVEFKAKLNKRVSMVYHYFNMIFNADANIVSEAKGLIFADIHVLDVTYLINKKHSVRTEFQTLFTRQDQGDWATIMVEYTISPGWFFAVLDQYNYGNPDPDARVHYLLGSVGYINKANRISLSYGRQREGIFCIGGVCRPVPAASGLTLTITSSF